MDRLFYGGDGGISARFARRIASAKPKILHLLLGFLGRQVLTRWVLIRTIKQNRHPQRDAFLFGGDGGISARFARRTASAKPKSFAFGLNFGASGTHPVGSHPHQNRKKSSQKGTLFLWRRWWDFRSLRSLDCFRQPKILRLLLGFLGRQVLTGGFSSAPK